jgi:PEGA domain
MNDRRSALLLGGALLLCACARATPGTPARATTAAPSACATGNGVGTLRLLLTPQPAVPETIEALVRIESESERSTVRVSATLGTTFELRPGRYRLTVSLPGYSSATRTTDVACGANEPLSIPLARKR